LRNSASYLNSMLDGWLNVRTIGKFIFGVSISLRKYFLKSSDLPTVFRYKMYQVEFQIQVIRLSE